MSIGDSKHMVGANASCEPCGGYGRIFDTMCGLHETCSACKGTGLAPQAATTGRPEILVANEAGVELGIERRDDGKWQFSATTCDGQRPRFNPAATTASAIDLSVQNVYRTGRKYGRERDSFYLEFSPVELLLFVKALIADGSIGQLPDATTTEGARTIKTWQERMPAPRIEYQCAMNCSPKSEGKDCGDCYPVKVHGDPAAARDAKIADLRAALARAPLPAQQVQAIDVARDAGGSK